MGKAQEVQEELMAVTTAEEANNSVKGLLDNYGRVYDVKGSKISLYIPLLPGSRPRYLYQIMLAVARLKQPSKSNVVSSMRAGRTSALNAIDHLYQHGYLRKVPKPRIIKPFGKYKIDTGYELTEKGMRTLYNILFV